MQRWYLIHSKPSGETKAKLNLERQGYETYFPRLLRTIKLAGRWTERIGALFPRYLFLRLDEDRQSLGPVRSTVGVAAVVGFGSRYSIVPDWVVGDLRLRESKEGLHHLGRGPRYARGCAVNVVGGPFEGLEGIFEREAGGDRVVILLNLLGQNTSVRVPADLVLPALAV